MIWSQPGEIVHATVSQKYPAQKRTGREAQVVQCLPSKGKALSSILPKQQTNKQIKTNAQIISVTSPILRI
jgi:hypothetical protein